MTSTSGPAPAVLIPGRVARVLGVLVLLILFGAGVAQLGGGVPGRDLLVWLVAAAQVGALALTWRLPLTGWRVSLLLAIVAAVVFPARIPDQSAVPWWPATTITHLLVVFLLAFVARRSLVLAAVLLDVCVFVGWALMAGATVEAAVLGPVALVLVAGLGLALGTQRRTAWELRESRRDAAAEQTRRAVLEERARIAREMHDVVAHHLSRIAVRAESAPVRVPDTGPAAVSELHEIAGDARDALTDMRRLLGVLRTDDPFSDGPAAPLGPTPDLSGVPELVDAARRAGTDVELSVTGDPAPGGIPAGIGLAGYRVVQESLSNAARHAPGAALAVSVHRSDEQVRVRVRNAPVPGGCPEDGDRGHGLIGMRERVEQAGGTIAAGPDPDGGWTVQALLPVARPVSERP